MPSLKTVVIEHIFNTRHDPATNGVANPIVVFNDIRDAITATGVNLSTSNLANFWKDLIRHGTLNQNWPASVFQRGWTGDDGIGVAPQASFRFVPVPPGQTTPFPPPLTPAPELLADPVPVQSLSLPVASKALGRSDETWIAQVAQRLLVVENHFVRASQLAVAEISFLQTGIKLTEGEVDAAYRLLLDDGTQWLLAAEVKSRREQLWIPQVLRAARALALTPIAAQVGGVIPFAVKVVGANLVHTVEFVPNLAGPTLTITAQSVFRLVPPVQGIS